MWTSSRVSIASLLLILVLAGGWELQAQPDVRQMSGVPLPVTDLAPGTVTVRVLRGSLTNPVTSQTVEILGAATSLTAVTNGEGRAEFTALRPGTRIKAAATVAGERLESQEFVVPASGGIRLMLVAAQQSGEAEPPGGAVAPAQPGTVVLSDESRFVFEAGEDGLSVFYILQIQNAAAAPVQPVQPVTFELPASARGVTILDGSSPQASVAGRELKIAGPFAPGLTLVQLGYTMPYVGPELAIEQKLPLALMHVAVVAQKVGDMRLASPQLAEQRDMPAQGNIYIAGRGGAVAAGETLRFNFSGMPHYPKWPRAVALALAAAVLAAGAWSSLRARDTKQSQSFQRQQLEKRREQLFAELTDLEAQYREQTIDPDRYAEQRRELVSALERIYMALDDDAALGRAS